jgi:hypothetical protein
MSHKRIANLKADFAGRRRPFSPDRSSWRRRTRHDGRVYDAGTGREVSRFDELLLGPLDLDCAPLGRWSWEEWTAYSA